MSWPSWRNGSISLRDCGGTEWCFHGNLISGADASCWIPGGRKRLSGRGCQRFPSAWAPGKRRVRRKLAAGSAWKPSFVALRVLCTKKYLSHGGFEPPSSSRSTWAGFAVCRWPLSGCGTEFPLPFGRGTPSLSFGSLLGSYVDPRWLSELHMRNGIIQEQVLFPKYCKATAPVGVGG